MTNWPVLAVGVVSILVGALTAIYTSVPWRKRLLDEFAILDRLPADSDNRAALSKLIDDDLDRYLRRRRDRVARTFVGAFWPELLAFGYGLFGVLGPPGVATVYLILFVPVLIAVVIGYFRSPHVPPHRQTTVASAQLVARPPTREIGRRKVPLGQMSASGVAPK